jgi:hypothetical protein
VALDVVPLRVTTVKSVKGLVGRIKPLSTTAMDDATRITDVRGRRRE